MVMTQYFCESERPIEMIYATGQYQVVLSLTGSVISVHRFYRYWHVDIKWGSNQVFT